MDANGNSSAYPLMPPLDSAGDSAHGYPYPESGLTKREAFAMAAMQGILANPSRLSPNADCSPREMCVAMARASIAFADALLAELAKETP